MKKETKRKSHWEFCPKCKQEYKTTTKKLCDNCSSKFYSKMKRDTKRNEQDI